MSKKIKTLAFIALAIAVIFVGYSFMSSKKTASTGSSSNPLVSTTGVIPLPGAPSTTPSSADEFSTILSKINSITIDTSLFSNRAYMMLRDFPVSLGSDVVGRADPFAPIGTDSGGPVSQDISIQTIQAGKVTGTTAEAGAQITVPNSTPTTVIFEYGTSDTFGNATAPIVVKKNGTVLATLTGLTPQTQYFVRAVAVSGGATTTANTTSFVTTKK